MEKIIKQIQEAITLYKETVEIIAQRHEQWQNLTEDLIFSTLSKCQDFGIQSVVKKTYRFINLETVYLSIRNERIAIYEEFDNEKHCLTKHGAHLRFSKTRQGKIIIDLLLPYIQEISPKQEPIFLATHLPEEISEELVLQYVLVFLQKIRQWEVE